MIRMEHISIVSDSAPSLPTEGRIALILLDRREKRNALTPDMLHNVAACVEEASHARDVSKRARAIILAGEGEAFSAGFDLKLCRDDPLALKALLVALADALRAIRSAPCSVVIGAHGAAIAGASAMLAACDFVVADTAIRIGYPVVRIGVSPAVSGPMLERAIGPGAARDRLLDPAVIDGRAADRLGLVHTLVDRPEMVRSAAIALAQRLAAKPAHALSATKRWLNEVDSSLDESQGARALEASLAIVGNVEERALLTEL